jgi:hypothetical protein
MSMSQDALLALARSLSGKGNVTSGDINTLLSPEVGRLTGTFYGQEGADEDDDEFMYLKYAPNFRAAMNLTDDNIRKIIANELAQGSAPWDVRRQIEEYTAAQANANPGLVNQEGETRDLLSFADKVYGEINSFSVASQERSRKASANDPFAAGGLPSPDMDFGMDRLAPDMFDMLSKRSQALEADTQKYQARGKSRQSALQFLEEQRNAVKQSDADRKADYASLGDFRVPNPDIAGSGESYLAAFKRNMANTPMGRGEAGPTGLIPQLKYLEQIPASLGALKNTIVNPTADLAFSAADYVARNTIGKGLPRYGGVGYGDIIPAMLYGSKQNKSESRGSQVPNDGSFDRAENARFGRTAQGVVDRSENVAKDVADTAQKSKWMQDYSSALDMLLKAKARSVGFTPYEETLTARSNFLRSGGL